MSDSWGAYDGNDKPSLTAVSTVDDKTIVRLVADPATGALLVSSTGTGNTFVYNEVVSGSGTSWTLAHSPKTGLYSVYANGQKLMPTTDYTISAANITTVLSWPAGEIAADYQY